LDTVINSLSSANHAYLKTLCKMMLWRLSTHLLLRLLLLRFFTRQIVRPNKPAAMNVARQIDK